MKKYLLIVLFLIFPVVVSATTLNTPVSNNLTYDECLHFQDNVVTTSGSVYIGQCKKATCQTGTWETNYLITNDMVRCTNGNTSEYIQIINDGCAEYKGVCTPSARTSKYCSVVTYYDCSRNRNGSNYIIPTTTTKATTTKTTTTKRTLTTRKSTTTTTKPTTTTTIKTTTMNTTIPVVLENNNYLKKLTISDGNINFDKNVLVYNIVVEKSVTHIDVIAEAESKKAKVIIENSNEINSEKPILITVTAEDSSTRVYTINIKYKENELSSDNLLKDLIIENYKIKFKPTNNNYKVRVSRDVNELNITPLLNDDNASYVIVDNENLKNNSKIKIIVTALNGNQNIYTITVKKTSMIVVYIILAIILGIIGVVAFKLIRNLIPIKKDDNYKYE